MKVKHVLSAHLDELIDVANNSDSKFYTFTSELEKDSRVFPLRIYSPQPYSEELQHELIAITREYDTKLIGGFIPTKSQNGLLELTSKQLIDFLPAIPHPATVNDVLATRRDELMSLCRNKGIVDMIFDEQELNTFTALNGEVKAHIQTKETLSYADKLLIKREFAAITGLTINTHIMARSDEFSISLAQDIRTTYDTNIKPKDKVLIRDLMQAFNPQLQKLKTVFGTSSIWVPEHLADAFVGDASLINAECSRHTPKYIQAVSRLLGVKLYIEMEFKEAV